MNREEYKQVKKIFQAALDIAPDERDAFLDESCRDNEDLRREVEKLLDSFDSQFLEMPAVANLADIVIEEKTEDEPTKILSDDESEPTKILPDAEPEVPPDENALRPSRLRFALVCLLLVFTAGWTLLNFAVFSWHGVERKWLFSGNKNTNGNYFVTKASETENVLLGDELLSVNGTEFSHENFLETEIQFKPGDHYKLGLRRGQALLSVELVVLPTSQIRVFERYFLVLLVPAVFLLVGGAVFLLKPNDKAALILVITYCLAVFVIPEVPRFVTIFGTVPQWLANIYGGVRYTGLACTTVALHFFLIFPERLRLVRRFPAVEYLLYLPCLIFILLPTWRTYLIPFDWMPLDSDWAQFYRKLTLIGLGIYGLAGLTALLFNYLQANKTNRRRIHLLTAGVTISYIPVTIFAAILIPLNLYQGGWMSFFTRLATIGSPFAFAYAVVRHKVIPVSFVVRRGLQYLLAKNALRLLLVLPILGIVWNIAANPNRTLSEILLQNSFSFYFYVLLAVALVLINRFGLREWIDRKFFREQYNQEKVLRELTEAVKESDSLAKLSRLVSSQIQAALHPSSVFLFFQEDRHSDFSLGYATSETSAATRLAADSPLLRFIQKERGTIEFPTRKTDDLPSREKQWLREIDANLLVPMFGTDGHLAGIFSLGEKLSQIPYTTRDKEMLGTLANQIALVHENLNLKDRMRREQRIKAEVLSRFDEGNINLLKECPKCGKCFDRTDENCADDDSELTFSLPVERTIEKRYQLEKLIGKGGMGAVYEATDLRINRRVAVKILSGAMFGNREALRRFEREAQTAGRLHHHNIVTIFDYGVLSTEGAFLVMELVEGESLGEVLKREGKLDSKIAAEWFSQILEGVEAAHKAGIVHRDLKPENIFVSKSETGETRLCILDFGLARLSETEIAAGASVTVPGTIIGTFGYMPPEQLRGEKTNERSDLFSIGVMIYEALRGEKPFRGKNYHEILNAMSKEVVFEREFQDFFKRGLAYKPENRFTSATEMKQNLPRVISS